MAKMLLGAATPLSLASAVIAAALGLALPPSSATPPPAGARPTAAPVPCAERLYNEECDLTLRAHARFLRALYDGYAATLDAVAGTPSFGLASWQKFVSDACLVSDDCTMRAVRFAFWRSKMFVVDEVAKRAKVTGLSWVEYLEALARLADSMSLPTDDDLATLGARDMLDFEHKLQSATDELAATLAYPRPSSEFLAPKTWPLAQKLDRLIRLILGRAGLMNKGMLAIGGKRLPLVGKYITTEQLKTLGLPKPRKATKERKEEK